VIARQLALRPQDYHLIGGATAGMRRTEAELEECRAHYLSLVQINPCEEVDTHAFVDIITEAWPTAEAYLVHEAYVSAEPIVEHPNPDNEEHYAVTYCQVEHQVALEHLAKLLRELIIPYHELMKED
jgi:hypothetical protein